MYWMFAKGQVLEKINVKFKSWIVKDIKKLNI